jgi:protein TonB
VASDDNVPPEYPAEMRERGVEAKVILKIVVSESGLVTKVEVLRGDEPFVSAAIAAVKTWRYSPALVGGEPTPVFRIVQLPFRLK